MTDQKSDYPKMPVKQWWALRNRFKQSIPGTVTASYLATVLGMEEISAGKNVLPALRRIGLVDQEGRPTELARRWRDDADYPSVCEEMKRAVYPQELIDAVPDPISNRNAAVRWFARGGAGASLVDKRVAFYQVLSEADPSKGQDSAKTSNNGKSTTKKESVTRKSRPSPVINNPSADSKPNTGNATENTEPHKKQQHSLQSFGPQLHIDIQIHISPDASPDQIDQIFASMAKHLYKQGLVNE